MGKPEWGAKHLCLSCGIRYYDMSAAPAVCPKCGTEAPSETAAKPRRSRKAKKPAAAPVQKAPPAKAELEEDDLEDVETDDEEDEIIEDASELDDESEDVTKVLDTAIEIEEV